MAILEDDVRLLYNSYINEEGEIEEIHDYTPVASTTYAPSTTIGIFEININRDTGVGGSLHYISGSVIGFQSIKVPILPGNIGIKGTMYTGALTVLSGTTDHQMSVISYNNYTYVSTGYNVYPTIATDTPLFKLDNNNEFASISTIDIPGTSPIGAVCAYKNRLVVGRQDGSIMFSTPNGDSFVVGSTVLDAQQFSISSNPIVDMIEAPNMLVILDNKGIIYIFSGDLLSESLTVGAYKVGQLSSTNTSYNSKQLTLINGNPYIITDNGIVKITNDIYTNNIIFSYQNEGFSKVLKLYKSITGINSVIYKANVLQGRFLLFNSNAYTNENTGLTMYYDIFTQKYGIYIFPTVEIAPGLTHYVSICYIADKAIYSSVNTFRVYDYDKSKTNTITPYYISKIYPKNVRTGYIPRVNLLYREDAAGTLKVSINGTVVVPEFDTIASADNYYDFLSYKTIPIGAMKDSYQFKIEFQGCKIIAIEPQEIKNK